MNAASTSGPDDSPSPPRKRMSKATKIGLGLLATFAGLFLMLRFVPTHPSSSFLETLGVGILLLWVGGILMGVGSRS
jgi:hypothetical protein